VVRTNSSLTTHSLTIRSLTIHSLTIHSLTFVRSKMEGTRLDHARMTGTDPPHVIGCKHPDFRRRGRSASRVYAPGPLTHAPEVLTPPDSCAQDSNTQHAILQSLVHPPLPSPHRLFTWTLAVAHHRSLSLNTTGTTARRSLPSDTAPAPAQTNKYINPRNRMDV
jgi:hypothetical protein